MDILNDVLRRFGFLLKAEASAACNDVLFAQLGSTRAATRKRAISCIAALSAALPDKLLGQVRRLPHTPVVGPWHDCRRRIELACASMHRPLRSALQLVASIVSRMEEPGMELELGRTYIQTLSAISRSGGHRLGRQVNVTPPAPFLIWAIGGAQSVERQSCEPQKDVQSSRG